MGSRERRRFCFSMTISYGLAELSNSLILLAGLTINFLTSFRTDFFHIVSASICL